MNVNNDFEREAGVSNLSMKGATKIIFFFTITLSFALAQGSDNGGSVEQQIKKLEQERLNAYPHLDSSALDRIMSDDYTSVYADGQIVTKSQEMQGIKSAPAGMLSSVTAKIDELSVRPYGTTALLTGRLTIKGKVVWSKKNIDINAACRYTAVYVKKRGRWRVVASQFTAIDESPEK